MLAFLWSPGVAITHQHLGRVLEIVWLLSSLSVPPLG